MNRKLTVGQSIFFDLARGLAAQLVLIGHTLSASGHGLKVTIQDIGVVIFFLISGFLVTYSVLNKSKSYQFRDYFTDRATRVLVPYFPALVFIFVCGYFFNLAGPLDFKTFITNCLLLQDFPLYRYLPFVPEFERYGTGRPLWSVAMEFWFYMGFSIIFFWNRLPIWAFIPAGIGLFVISFGLTVGMLPFTWLCGAIIAFYFLKAKKLSTSLTFFIAIISAILIIYRWKIVHGEFYDLALNLLIGIVFLCCVELMHNVSFSKIYKFNFQTLAKWLGNISYSLYLTHYTVLAIIQSDFYFIPRELLVIVMANFVGLIFFFAFECHHKKIAFYIRDKLNNAYPSKPIKP